MANPTTYYRPTTLAEAYELAQQPDAITLAGGALTLNALDVPFTTVIDVQDIPELREVDTSADGATFGAAVTIQRVLEWEQLSNTFRRALTRTIPLNIRNNLSILESLRQRTHPMLREWLAVIAAHDIGVGRYESGETDWVNVGSFFMHPDQFEGAFITGIDIPTVPPNQALGAAYVARTPADFAIVNAAVYVYLNNQRRVETAFVALCGASPEPVRMVELDTLIGNPLDEANIASAVKRVAPQVDPVEDYLGSADYRREMARVVVQRALADCMAQFN